MNMCDIGVTYWLTGLSGAGKTTIGKKLYGYLSNKQDNLVLLDGDVLRDVFQSKDYSLEGRIGLGYKYSRLCRMLNNQGIDVIICTIAMFDDVRAWNRDNIKNYREVYIKVSMDELIKRDQKGLYTRALEGKEENVMGINAEFEEPKKPDLVLLNYGNNSADDSLSLIINEWNL